MITPTDIIKHLKEYLPQVTDLFTDKLSAVGATVTGSVLSVNIVGHGFITGQNIVITPGETNNPIISSVLTVDNTVRFGTQFEHDLVTPQFPNDNQTLTLSGVGGAWDWIHQIDNIPSRMFFEIALPPGEVVAPAPAGYLIDSTGLGLQTVSSVVDADNFTIDISGLPDMPTGSVNNLEVITGFRIAGASSIDRAQKAYSKQNKDVPYLFVIMGGVDVSKDRHTQNDSIAGFTAQDKMLLRLLQGFSTVVFYPTADDITGVAAHDALYDVIYKALIKVLYGFEFADVDNSISYVTVSAGHGEGIYNSAYLTHVYDWQLPSAITVESGFDMQPDVAFRDIEQDANLFGDEYATMSTNINLDEETP